jgi:hypothetical protein
MMAVKASRKFDPVNCNYTTWSPDTCGCTITYEWDKSTIDKPELREHRPVHHDVIIIGSSGEPVQHNIKCDAHKHHNAIEEHFGAVLEENQRMNRAHFALNNGEKPIEWFWEGKSPDRILHIKGGEPAGHGDKSTVQSVIEKELAHYGHGKVILD